MVLAQSNIFIAGAGKKHIRFTKKYDDFIPVLLQRRRENRRMFVKRKVLYMH